jgi:hypothetical protein
MNRRFLAVLAVVTLLAAAPAKVSSSPRGMAEVIEQRGGPVNNEIVSLLEQSSGMPIEYRADITFQILNREHILSSHMRSVLDPIFYAAESAHNAFPIRDAVRVDDSLSSERERASSAGLDSLTIRTRVIDKLLPSNPVHALTLAEEIKLKVPQSSCSDFVVSDVSSYYALIGEMSSRVGGGNLHNRTTALERESVEHISSSLELRPAGKLVSSISQESLFLELLADLMHAINNVTASDRELLDIDNNGEFSSLVGALLEKAEQDSISPVPLIEAYRGFLVRSLSGAECGFRPTNRQIQAQRFNALLEKHHLSGVNRLSEKELLGKQEQHFTVEKSLPDYPEFRPVMHLMFLAHDVELAERPSPNEDSAYKLSQANVDDYLNLLDNVTARKDSCLACKFVSESQLYFVLIDSIPSYLNPDQAIDSYIQWCAGNPMQKDDPELWLARLKPILNLNRNVTTADSEKLVELRKQGKVLNALPHPSYGEILKAARESTSNVVRVYAYAERVLMPNYQMPF